MLAFAPQDAIVQLDSLITSARLPARDANRCAHLAETLRRPARVCLLGPDDGDIASILLALLGRSDLPSDNLPPAVQLQYGSKLCSTATLEDGTTLTVGDWPTDDILQRNPVFLQIDLPVSRLRPMSILVLALEADPTMYRPALSWAARRSEIAVWCTESFKNADAAMWGLAPERLTQHAYLLETRPDPSNRPHDTDANFTHSFALNNFRPSEVLPDIAPLYDRLIADIEDARIADLDMAHLFLHRFGHLRANTHDTADEEFISGQSNVQPLPSLDLRLLLSEPFLFLVTRASDLANQLVPEPSDGIWPALVLTHCVDTMDGLHDRAENWPDDIATAQSLQAMIEEICDLLVLLKIEGKAEQAQDATALLFQLRIAFEQALEWEKQ